MDGGLRSSYPLVSVIGVSTCFGVTFSNGFCLEIFKWLFPTAVFSELKVCFFLSRFGSEKRK